MINKEANEKSIQAGNKQTQLYKLDILLFGVVLFLMLIRFFGIFKNVELPGWNTPAHFFTLLKMTEYLSQGHITGYLNEWLLGMPLFQFYAPLFFIIVGGLWLITFKIMPLVFLFRVFVFLTVFSVSVSLWYFVKTFFNYQVARWAILLSTVFIFYPKSLSFFGIGAGAVIQGGMITSVLGLSLVLLWLSFLENLKRNPISVKFYVLTILSAAALILTNTISFIAGVILFFTYLFYNFRNKAIIFRGVITLLISLALSSFWFIPFIANLQLSSAESRGPVDLSINIFFMLFPVIIPCLVLGAIVFFLFAVAGLISLLRDKEFISLFLLGGITLFFLVKKQSTLFLSEITINYQRFLPFLFILILTIITYAIWRLWRDWSNGIKWRKAFLAALIFFILINFFCAFDAKNGVVGSQPILWSWDEFKNASEAERLLERLKTIPDLKRVFVQISSSDGLASFGSPQYFAGRVPLKNNQYIVTGTYVESAPLTPFILPTLDAITSGETQVSGDTRLKLVNPFYNQNKIVHLQRLKRFGINYIVSYTPEFSSIISGIKQAELIDSIERFNIFKIKDSYPFVYPAKYKPAIYINLYGEPTFRDLAMVFFAGSETYDFPVVEVKEELKKINKDSLDKFSVVIISGSRLTKADLDILNKFNHPIIFLNTAKIPVENFFQNNVYFVNKLETIPKQRIMPYNTWPEGWSELMNIIVQYKDRYEIFEDNPVFIKEFNNERIVVAGNGPLIINSGYSPYWLPKNCTDCYTYRVSPDQIMIFGNGKTIVLEYSSDLVKKFSTGISIITVIILLSHVLFIIVKKRKKLLCFWIKNE